MRLAYKKVKLQSFLSHDVDSDIEEHADKPIMSKRDALNIKPVPKSAYQLSVVTATSIVVRACAFAFKRVSLHRTLTCQIIRAILAKTVFVLIELVE